MKKVIIFLCALVEVIFYLFVNITLSSIDISSTILSIILYIVSEFLIAYILYLIFKLVIKKFKMEKKYIYYIICINIFLTTIIPVLIAIIIPNETIMLLAIALIIGTLYYGVLINIIIALLNKFRNKA